MKTSLNLNDQIFEAAKAEAYSTGKTLSEVISNWAAAGRAATQKAQRKKKSFEPLDLGGGPAIDLSNRSRWIEELED
jgi:hypothetical protein